MTLFRTGLRKARSLGVRLWSKPAKRPSPPSGCSPLRVAIVGFGTMGKQHADCMTDSNVFSLVAICSQSADAETVKAKYGAKLFGCLDELLNDKRCDVDVVVIATPHRRHADAVMAGLRDNKHVICEKPMAVSCTDAAEMMHAAQDSGSKFTVMSQTRFEPSYLKVKALLDSSHFGEVRRCSLTETYLRSEAYYQKATWRGTWAGEGGGVLVNQAPHVLDRYRWLCGCPDTIMAVCETLHHSISVEDSATLTCTHSNGLTGEIHVSTNEYPQARLELVCDRGRIIVQDGSITVTRWTPSLTESIKQTDASAANLVATTEQLGGTLLNWSDNLLHDFYENFAQSVWFGSEPLVSTDEANDVVHMINAAQLSAWLKRPIGLPAECDTYAAFQQQMKLEEAARQ